MKKQCADFCSTILWNVQFGGMPGMQFDVRESTKGFDKKY